MKITKFVVAAWAALALAAVPAGASASGITAAGDRTAAGGTAAQLMGAQGMGARGMAARAMGAAAAAGAAGSPAAAPDFRHACSDAPPRGHAQCLALVRSSGTVYAGVNRAVTPPGYGPADLRSAYDLTQAAAAAGRGQTVAVVDAYNDPNAAANLAVYRKQYHLPACTAKNGCLRIVNQRGAASPLPPPAGRTGWGDEESLDLDMVSAICPNCHIILVEADNDDIGSLGAAVNAAVSLGARFVSNSYSEAEEAGETANDAYYDHPGVVMTASGGDSGYGVVYPAASPYVTSVGGTALVRARRTARGWSETVWNRAGATGSGCSAYEAKPAWQTDPGCPRRTDNDVAAVADPDTGVAVYDTYAGNGGWEEFGGTSVGSPIIAATYALAGPPAGATPAEYPYEHTNRLYDVTAGSDGSCGGSYLCTAKAGYDGPTGWGTPNGTGAFQSIDNAIRVTSPGTRHSTAGRKVAPLKIAAADSASGQALTFSATGLPAGLSISSGGAISGTPKTHGYYRVRVYATDATGIAAAAAFSWVVRSAGAVRSRLVGQCLDDWHGRTTNRNKIDVYQCNRSRAQAWSVNPQANGTVQISLVKAPGTCVTVPGNAAAAGPKVILYRCGSVGQAWRAGGNGHLVNPRSGLCLTDPHAGRNGTQLDMTRCAKTAAERWSLP